MNYLPYLLKDIGCVVKALALGSFSLPHIGLPHIPFPHFKIPFLLANSTMLANGNGTYATVMSDDLMANYTDLIQYFAAYAANAYMRNLEEASNQVDVLFPDF